MVILSERGSRLSIFIVLPVVAPTQNIKNIYFLDNQEDFDLEIVNVEDDDDEPPLKQSFTDIKPAPDFVKAMG